MTFKSLSIGCFLALGLAGCNSTGFNARLPDPAVSSLDAKMLAMVPSVELPAQFQRQQIDYVTKEAPGSVVIDSRAHFLYYVLPNKRAIRYGVATGAEAAGWSGVAQVARKAEWPHWLPPADMLQRWPHLKPTVDAGGLPGGPDNPLGARAMYLFQNNHDTLYRIHGTNEPESIGKDVSSGCIRLTNIDAIDLFNRVKVGAKVVVL
jgi:lipoprotein-anchoring transpeptidase ErfK/SrfK